MKIYYSGNNHVCCAVPRTEEQVKRDTDNFACCPICLNRLPNVERAFFHDELVELNSRKKIFSFTGLEVIEKTVKPHSTSAHVGVPKDWIGCSVAIVRLDA